MRIPRTGLASMHGQAITGARRINILFQAGVSMIGFKYLSTTTTILND